MLSTVTPPSGKILDDWQPLKLRAPAGHGDTFARPDLSEAVAAVKANRKTFETDGPLELGNRSLALLRSGARLEFLATAIRYTRQWVADCKPAALSSNSTARLSAYAERPLIVGGHQPVFYHPGVWAKNFAASRVARESAGTVINLVVDNDARTSVGVAVPRGNRLACTREELDYDDRDISRPWEEVRVANLEQFASFAGRAGSAMAPWGVTPLLEATWPGVVDAVRAGMPLVTAMTASRNRLERDWGLENLEIPVSWMSRMVTFHWFTADLLSRVPQVHTAYNTTVQRYRNVNRVRNALHPVPDLRREGERFETPFWVWKAGETRRGRLFAEQTATGVELTDGVRHVATLPFPENGDRCCAVAQLSLLEGLGWKIRPRALTLTLFARVFLADLFVHGIGGAKYDEMTDRLIPQLYGIAAPQFLVVTTTVHLPLGAFPATPADVSRVQSQLRELDFHAEKHLSLDQTRDFEGLIAEKATLAAEQLAAEPWRRPPLTPTAPTIRSADRKVQGRTRFRRLAEINRLLSQPLASRREELQRELARFQAEVRANRVLRSREFAFALFPSDLLRPILRSVAGLEDRVGS
jgi:hypothetical protein